MNHEHCNECDSTARKIHELESRLEHTEDRLNEANEHLQEVERGARSLYESIKTGF